MARVEILEVTKRYKSVLAVDNVSLDVRDQEFLVLLGPSGCGKSTLLKMIAGLEEITSGEIYIDDRLVNYVPPRDRDISMVFQNYALYPHMSVFDNIGFPLKMAGEKKDAIKRKVDEVARVLALDALLQRRPEQLSGGQRQRVALGRAIIRNPKVFLMDEPLSNLDALLRVQMREELLRLHKRVEGTIVYVTHDQVEAMTMGDRVVVMKDGIVQQLGEPQAVYDQPANTFVATFIGSPAMSLFPGQVEAHNGGHAFVSPELRLPLNGRLSKAVTQLPASSGEVMLGIRSEHVLVTPKPNPDGIAARTVFVEPVGSDMYVSLQIGDRSCVARTEPRTDLEENQPVWLTFVPEKQHLFSADGRNVLEPNAPPPGR